MYLRNVSHFGHRFTPEKSNNKNQYLCLVAVKVSAEAKCRALSQGRRRVLLFTGGCFPRQVPSSHPQLPVQLCLSPEPAGLGTVIPQVSAILVLSPFHSSDGSQGFPAWAELRHSPQPLVMNTPNTPCSLELQGDKREMRGEERKCEVIDKNTIPLIIPSVRLITRL